MRQLCCHIQDKQLNRKITSAAKTPKVDETGLYAGHTDRYRGDTEYRSRCQETSPPIPEWFVFTDGRIAPLKGGPSWEAFGDVTWDFPIY